MGPKSYLKLIQIFQIWGCCDLKYMKCLKLIIRKKKRSVMRLGGRKSRIFIDFCGLLPNASVFLVFSSGKLVCTGAKKVEDIFAAVNKLHTTLEEQDLMIY